MNQLYTVGDIGRILEDLAPLNTAESWDNVGLLLGDFKRPVRHITLALDFDDATLALAKTHQSDLIVVHHPPIFPTIDRLTSATAMGRRLLAAARDGVAVYAAHTNLDAAPGGVNDALAAVLGVAVDDVIERLETDETQAVLREDAVATRLRGAFDIPDLPFGFGRIGAFYDGKISRRGMVRVVNNKLQTGGCILNFDEDALVNRIAVAGGSFDEEWIPSLIEKGVDLLISGEIKHHVMLQLAEAGIAAIIAGHEMTERVILYPLANYIGLRTADLGFAINSGLDYNKIVF